MYEQNHIQSHQNDNDWKSRTPIDQKSVTISLLNPARSTGNLCFIVCLKTQIKGEGNVTVLFYMSAYYS